MKTQVNIQEVIEYLNALLIVDRLAIETFFNIRVLCNDKMAKHPTVQVGKLANRHVFGIIGILNGLFGVNEKGWGCFGVDLNEDNSIKCFRLVREDDIPSSVKEK